MSKRHLYSAALAFLLILGSLGAEPGATTQPATQEGPVAGGLTEKDFEKMFMDAFVELGKASTAPATQAAPLSDKEIVRAMQRNALKLLAALKWGTTAPFTQMAPGELDRALDALIDEAERRAKAPPLEPATHKALARPDRPWEVVGTKEFTIAVPKGWRKLPELVLNNVVYLNGDGIGAPVVDETGNPIQIGMAVERYGKVKDSAVEGAKRNLGTLEYDPRLKVLSKNPPQPLKLSDGTDAAFNRVLLIEDRSRKSLQMKLFAADSNSRGWVVSAWIVTGRDSQFIENNAPLENRLRAHVTSLCFDQSKFNTSALAAAYGGRPTQPATVAPAARDRK